MVPCGASVWEFTFEWGRGMWDISLLEPTQEKPSAHHFNTNHTNSSQHQTCLSQETAWLSKDLPDQVNPGWGPCLEGGRCPGLRSPVDVLTTQLFGLLILLSSHQENVKLWSSSGATTFFESQETFFTLRGNKTISHSIPLLWNKTKKIINQSRKVWVQCIVPQSFGSTHRREMSQAQAQSGMLLEIRAPQLPNLGLKHKAQNPQASPYCSPLDRNIKEVKCYARSCTMSSASIWNLGIIDSCSQNHFYWGKREIEIERDCY